MKGFDIFKGQKIQVNILPDEWEIKTIVSLEENRKYEETLSVNGQIENNEVIVYIITCTDGLTLEYDSIKNIPFVRSTKKSIDNITIDILDVGLRLKGVQLNRVILDTINDVI